MDNCLISHVLLRDLSLRVSDLHRKVDSCALIRLAVKLDASTKGDGELLGSAQPDPNTLSLERWLFYIAKCLEQTSEAIVIYAGTGVDDLRQDVA